LLHTVIEGEPGTGKTELAEKIGKVYLKLGILKNDIFKKVKRSDLIAGYLGQTAIKTARLIEECKGGVLFIDEAYSLGNAEGKDGRDSFSKECIDVLNQSLTENKNNFVCIIAGYKEDLEKSKIKLVELEKIKLGKEKTVSYYKNFIDLISDVDNILVQYIVSPIS
jgi:SpoVK/Ycf46/Vps4 family AAA+-type ATPase